MVLMPGVTVGRAVVPNCDVMKEEETELVMVSVSEVACAWHLCAALYAQEVAPPKQVIVPHHSYRHPRGPDPWMTAPYLPDLHGGLEVPGRWMIGPCQSDPHGGVIPGAAYYRRCFWSSPDVVFAEIVVDGDAIVLWHHDALRQEVYCRQVLHRAAFLCASVV